jgi:aminoglycoside phosphotransferase (APT) family kinase protein
VVASANRLAWIADPSPGSLRAGLAEVAPSLADRDLVLAPQLHRPDPQYFQGTAVVGRSYLVKFAWSEEPARRVVHEAHVLEALRDIVPDLPIPRLEAFSSTPALFVTRLAPGEPLTIAQASGLNEDMRSHFARQLGGFLAVLHRPETLQALRAKGISLAVPEPQADTSALRARFPRLVDVKQAQQVSRWCEWVDDVQRRAHSEVALHGDLHGYNFVWEPDKAKLNLVADFETASRGDPAYDFRYLPGQASTTDFLRSVIDAYEQASGTTVDLDQVMAWNVRTVLGDALWRSEAKVALPDGRSVPEWVTDLTRRMRLLAPSAGT